MGDHSKRLFFLCLCMVFLLSGTTFTANSRQESGGFYLWEGESHPIRIGYLPSGEVVRGSYSSDGSSIEFFIVDGGNYSRWVDGLTYDRHSYRYGTSEGFSFTVPYNDTWFAVFYNPSATLFDYVMYNIGTGSPRSVDYERILPVLGVAVLIVVVMVIFVKVTYSRPKKPIYKRIIEIKAEPAHEEETTPKEVAAESHEPVPRSELECSHCGSENPITAEFCVGCGRYLGETDKADQQ